MNTRTNDSQPKMSLTRASEFLEISTQAIHKQLKSKNIICDKLGNKSYLTHKKARSFFNIDFKPKVIAGQIVKGGTGKTTIIEHISSCINTYGARVLKIDADPQGNLTDVSGVDAENLPVLIDIIKEDATVEESIISIHDGIDLIPSRIENVVLDNVIINERLPLHTLYSDLLESVADRYDYIFIDCPPTMGQAIAAVSLFADTILAPLNPDKFSVKGLKILIQEINILNKRFKKNIKYKVFLNKFSGRTILSDKTIMSLLSDPILEGSVLSTTIQRTQEIPNITDLNQNLFCHLKKSPTRGDFDLLTRELLQIFPSNHSVKNL